MDWDGNGCVYGCMDARMHVFTYDMWVVQCDACHVISCHVMSCNIAMVCMVGMVCIACICMYGTRMVWYGKVWYGMACYGLVWNRTEWNVCMSVCMFACMYVNESLCDRIYGLRSYVKIHPYLQLSQNAHFPFYFKNGNMGTMPFGVSRVPERFAFNDPKWQWLIVTTSPNIRIL